ncbi:MAG: branched-chain amino acid ABC transporter permease [Candidatus Rokubacteria bacterium]|nr:branched-chain amino acid ABC transporter permease [Candidatus Rokubacteria bacterium]
MGLAFVVVYKASRMINFALGEWIMVSAGLVAAGLHAFSLGLAGAVAAACAGMILLALIFNRVVVRPLVGRPVIALIMVTLGLAALLRGAAFLTLRGIPGRITLPLSGETLAAYDIFVAPEKLAAGAVAVVAVALIAAFFRWSRTGIALRAIADDQQIAMSMGIDLPTHLALAWAAAGVIAVIAGTLWTAAVGGGLSLVLVGLKVFPVVVIGGLDSIPGTIVAAVLVGLLETLAAGYLDPVVGAGFSNVASYVVLIAMLFARPHGLFGRPDVARV